MAHRLYLVVNTIQCKIATYCSLPHIKTLTNISQVFYLHTISQFQTNDTQMQTMWIHPQPVGSILLTPCLFELASIKFLVPTAEIKLFQRIFRLKVLRIWETMPPPLALCS